MGPATRETLRRLAGARGAPVLSVYLDLDPSRFGTSSARESELASLLDGAVRAGPRPREEQSSLQVDVARVRRLLEDEPSVPGARGIAVFASAPAGLFEVVKLQEPVVPLAHVSDAPFIEPLVEQLATDTWCVFLVNSRSARMLWGTRDRLEDTKALRDVVPGRHEQGGWSQARFRRHVEQHVQDHVKRACDALFDVSRDLPFDHLLLAAPPELWPQVEAKLHPYLAERLAGRIEVDVEHATADDVLRHARPALEAAEHRTEREALDRLNQALATGGRAAAGLEAVLDALNAKRVETLLFDPGFQPRGVVCPSCRWAGTSGDTCPLDGVAVGDRPDVIDVVLERAVAQGADLLTVRHDDDLHRLGRVAALLRF